jgi:Flp pilus assembly protein TadD
MPQIRFLTPPRRALCAAAVVSVLAFAAVGAPTLAASPPPAAGTPASNLKLARTLRGAGELNAAIGAYRAVAAVKPVDPAVLAEFGDALLSAGLIDESIGVYSEVSLQSKSAADALMGLSRAQLSLDSPAKALVYADRAIAAAPAEPRAQILRGVILDGMGRHAEAQICYRSALKQEPRGLAARNDLALSLAITGQYAEAIDILGPIARSSDATPGLRQNLALIYGLKGDRDKALALGRADLDPAAAEANQRFADMVRSSQKKTP